MGIQTNEFRKQLKRASPEIERVLYTENNWNWIQSLSEKRHLAAHRGSLILQPFYNVPQDIPGDEIIQEELESLPTVQAIRQLLPEKAASYLIAVKRIELYLSKCELLTDECTMMSVDGKTQIRRPLEEVESDVGNFERILSEVLEKVIK